MSVVNLLKSFHLESKNILVACSGGLDSTVLIHAISHLQLNATILHVNYHLRDEESDLDFAKFKFGLEV